MPHKDLAARRKYAREYGRRRRQENPAASVDKCRADYRKTKNAAYDKLGNKCANPACRWFNEDESWGCVDRRCLQIDHVNDDGYLNRMRGYQLHLAVLRDVDNQFQLLCANCNWLKKARMHTGFYT